MAFSISQADIPIQSQIENLLTCSICLETFKNPRTLPCFHSFCEHCLGKFVKSQRDKALEKKIEEFNCPTCQSTFSMKLNDDVESLSSSNFIRNMLDVVSVQRQAKSKATKCSKIRCDKTAIAHCMKCELFMCETCLEFHGSWPAFVKHTVLWISELTEATAKNHAMLRGKPRCSKHESKVLKFYCQTCEKLVCRYCMDFDHAKQNHPCVPAEDVADEKRQSFKTSVDSLEDKLRKGSEALEAVTNVTQLLKENLERAKVEVYLHKQEILNRIARQLDQRVQGIINDLDNEYNQSYESLAKQCSALQPLVDKVKSSLDFSKNILEIGNLDDILSSQGMIEQTIDELDSDCPQTAKPVTDGNIQYKRDTISVERLTELCDDLLGVAGKGHACCLVRIEIVKGWCTCEICMEFV